MTKLFILSTQIDLTTNQIILISDEGARGRPPAPSVLKRMIFLFVRILAVGEINVVTLSEGSERPRELAERSEERARRVKQGCLDAGL